MPKGVYVRTELHKKINSEAHLGYKHSDAWKRRHSEMIKGRPSRLKGRPLSHKEGCLCGPCKAKRGETLGTGNNNWKGDDVGYIGIHEWLYVNYGKASFCENPNCPGTSKNYDWSNVSGLYKRDKSDWQQLCHSCHRLFDNGRLLLQQETS